MRNAGGWRMGMDNHNQYEAEAVAVQQWATRRKCIENIDLPPGPARALRHAEIDNFAESMTEALKALFLEPAAYPYRLRLYKGARG